MTSTPRPCQPRTRPPAATQPLGQHAGHGVNGSLLQRLAHGLKAMVGLGTQTTPSHQEALAQTMNTRLQDAANVWTSHIQLAQRQMQDATVQLLGGFAEVLTQLDEVTGADTPGSSPGAQHGQLESRAALLEQCETRLRGLIDNFQVFVQSREDVMQSVRTLASSSTGLREMAEDVAKLARQTNLLSVNAAIEAARAGPGGRGFAVVATEVRRLSGESGRTGRHIEEQVNALGERMQLALRDAAVHVERDRSVIQASEQTINQVVEQVDHTVLQLHHRAKDLAARGELIKTQVQQLMIAFQFQDRVQQILSQVDASIADSVQHLQAAWLQGVAPTAQDWSARLARGYTTQEQHHATKAPAAHMATAAHVATAAAPQTTFF